VARGGGTGPAPAQGDSPQITIVNNCQFNIWPGILGRPVVENGGFHLGPSERRTFSVPNGWEAARIWARTGCDGNMNCDTGFCKVTKQLR
jgi:hypothetical protein